ncbi:MAG: inorganic phosphate transporter [Candidatus Coatesbacteria bacterium]|nr:MAG: inorganic phosphate transporter [Candidatus Coatesbacteria bacterium]
MVLGTLFLTSVVVIIALIYDFFNGVNDCANAIATTVSTRALPPWAAVLMAGGFNVFGAFVTTAVAKTMGKGIVDPSAIGMDVVVFALLGATIWTAVCTKYGIPISITHSLVGGLMGAALIAAGPEVLKPQGLIKVFLAMIISPIAGFAAGYVIMVAMLWAAKRATPSGANKFFRTTQILSAAFMAFTHGMNDTQNAMGVITAALFIGGFIATFEVPKLVILACGLAMGLGTAIGGWRVIRTMGSRVVKLEPVHGFSAETAAAVVIGVNSFLGMPISTTHVISTAIMGVGSTRKFSAVRWGVARSIVVAWILTVPAAALISALTYAIYAVVKIGVLNVY